MCGPHQVWPLRSECCGRGVPTTVVCAECMKMCRLGGKNSVVKGLTSSFARFARSATSPLFAYMTIYSGAEQLSVQTAAPRDCVRFGCCSPIASIRFKLLSPVSVRFRCCSPLAFASAALSPRPDCVSFGCSSPIASDSTAAPRLRPLQLQLSDCVHFDCCSPLHPLVTSPVLEDSSPCPMFSNFLRRVRGSVNN